MRSSARGTGTASPQPSTQHTFFLRVVIEILRQTQYQPYRGQIAYRTGISDMMLKIKELIRSVEKYLLFVRGRGVKTCPNRKQPNQAFDARQRIRAGAGGRGK